MKKTKAKSQRASMPVGKFVAVKAARLNKDGSVTLQLPGSAIGRARNTDGFKDAFGRFHPIRSGDDYDPEDVGERRAYAPAKRKPAKRKAR